MIWMLKEELAELVQHLTDAQEELENFRRISGNAPNWYHAPRGEAVLLAREIWFAGSTTVLTEGGWQDSNQHLRKALLMKKDNDNDTKKECTEPVWPGECPAPKPGTETKDGDETIIVPIVR